MADQNKNAALKDVRPAPLGRGLAALFGDADSSYRPPATQPSAERPQRMLPVTWLQPGMYQPRRNFDESALEDLANSVRERGVLQPLLVRPLKETNAYEIIAGERRWRAAQMAGVHEIPVIIRNLSDEDALEVALIENVQRQDLSPLEEALGYQRLMDDFAHTQETLAKVVGKSRSHIANALRLLQLPENVKGMIDRGEITAGHARTLVTAADPEKLAQDIVRNGLSVRQAEDLTRSNNARAKKKNARPHLVSADTLALEKEMTNLTGLKTKLTANSDGSGAVTIRYKNLEQLDGLIARLRD